RDLVLQRKYVVQIPIVALGPDMTVFDSIDQLRRDSNPAGHLAHATFDDISDVQLAGDDASTDRLPLKSKGCVPLQYVQGVHLGQIGDNVLGDAVAEVFLLRIAAHVGERKDGDCGIAGNSLVQGAGGGGVERQPVGANGLANVLQALRTEILERRVDLVPNVVDGGTRADDRAWLGHCFEASGDVDPIAKQIDTLDNDITQLMPMRSTMRRSSGKSTFSAPMPRCRLMAHCTAWTALPNSTRT